MLTTFVYLPFLQAEEVFILDFRNGKTTLDDWEKVFDADSEAAKKEGAVRVEDPPGNVEGLHTALVLRDVLDSSRDKQSNEAGTPLFTSSFEPITSGKVTFRAGTNGTQNQNASLTLLAKGRPVLILRLVNNQEGLVVGGESHMSFEDEMPWFNRARDFSIAWDDSGEFTVGFVNHEGEKILLGPLRPLAPGAPDQIDFQVGFGRAVDKALRIEQLTLFSEK